MPAERKDTAFSIMFKKLDEQQKAALAARVLDSITEKQGVSWTIDQEDNTLYAEWDEGINTDKIKQMLTEAGVVNDAFTFGDEDISVTPAGFFKILNKEKDNPEIRGAMEEMLGYRVVTEDDIALLTGLGFEDKNTFPLTDGNWSYVPAEDEKHPCLNLVLDPFPGRVRFENPSRELVGIEGFYERMVAAMNKAAGNPGQFSISRGPERTNNYTLSVRYIDPAFTSNIDAIKARVKTYGDILLEELVALERYDDDLEKTESNPTKADPARNAANFLHKVTKSLEWESDGQGNLVTAISHLGQRERNVVLRQLKEAGIRDLTVTGEINIIVALAVVDEAWKTRNNIPVIGNMLWDMTGVRWEVSKDGQYLSIREVSDSPVNQETPLTPDNATIRAELIKNRVDPDKIQETDKGGLQIAVDYLTGLYESGKLVHPVSREVHSDFDKQEIRAFSI